MSMSQTTHTASTAAEAPAPYRCGDRICATTPEGTRFLARVESVTPHADRASSACSPPSSSRVATAATCSPPWSAPTASAPPSVPGADSAPARDRQPAARPDGERGDVQPPLVAAPAVLRHAVLLG